MRALPLRSTQPRIPARFSTMKRTRKAFKATIAISTIMTVLYRHPVELPGLRSSHSRVRDKPTLHSLGHQRSPPALHKEHDCLQGPTAGLRLHYPAALLPERLSQHSVSVPARFYWYTFLLSPRNGSMAIAHEPTAPYRSCECLGQRERKVSAAPGASVPYHCL